MKEEAVTLHLSRFQNERGGVGLVAAIADGGVVYTAAAPREGKNRAVAASKYRFRNRQRPNGRFMTSQEHMLSKENMERDFLPFHTKMSMAN